MLAISTASHYKYLLGSSTTLNLHHLTLFLSSIYLRLQIHKPCTGVTLGYGREKPNKSKTESAAAAATGQEKN
jgi:hypothetical protein